MAYGIGASSAVAVVRQLSKEENMFVNKYFITLVLFQALFFVPADGLTMELSTLGKYAVISDTWCYSFLVNFIMVYYKYYKCNISIYYLLSTYKKRKRLWCI
ncbi:MAG: hypothetical protein ACTSPQ_17990 [Candidatus Helarchaeota archaeon]